MSVRKIAAPYAILFLLFSLSGCASVEEQRREPAPPIAEIVSPKPAIPEQAKPEQTAPMRQPRSQDGTSKSYQARAKTDRPLLTEKGYLEKGIASWYGPSFHGRPTSCGETFDMYKPSAAHRLLPMHTKICVTNLENGKSLNLTVNDRGPYIPGRILDLSYAAAKSLAMIEKGLARILIRTPGPVKGQNTNDLTGDFFVHVGSFEAQTDAVLLLEDMKSLRYKPSILKVVRVDRGRESLLWRVEVGPFKTVSDAEKAQSRVVNDYPSAFVVAKE